MKLPLNTRAQHGKLLKIMWPKDPFYRKSLEYRLADTWNNLTIDTRNLDTFDKFQGWNKQFYLDKCTT